MPSSLPRKNDSSIRAVDSTYPDGLVEIDVRRPFGILNAFDSENPSYAPRDDVMFRELDVGQSALLTDIAMCVNYYRLFTPGLYCCVHATVQLEDGTRFIPGIVVQVNHGPLKLCDPDPSYIYFNGPPNFVLDVFSGDDLHDYEHRRECFERAGVFEYVAVRLMDELDWTWNRLIDGKFTEIKTADNELITSAALPGLWIPSYALKNQNWWAIMAAIARGVSRVGHHEFMDTICKAGIRTQEQLRQSFEDYQSGRMGQNA